MQLTPTRARDPTRVHVRVCAPTIIRKATTNSDFRLGLPLMGLDFSNRAKLTERLPTVSSKSDCRERVLWPDSTCPDLT